MAYNRGLFVSSHAQIARIFSDRDRRHIARGWYRLYLHAASVRAAERLAAATPVAGATLQVDPTEEEVTVADGKVGGSNPAVAGAATATEELLGVGVGVDNAAMAARVRAEKAEGALRRQGGRLVRTSRGELRCSYNMLWGSGTLTTQRK